MSTVIQETFVVLQWSCGSLGEFERVYAVFHKESDAKFCVALYDDMGSDDYYLTYQKSEIRAM